MILNLREIYEYREMLKSLVKKELRTRYKASFLGFLWTFVNPLMQLIVYSLIFPYLLRFNQENYAMFLFVALIPWSYFTHALQGGCGIIVYNSSMVTKVYFPREILPIAFSLSGLFNMIFAYAIVFPILLLFRIPITWNILWLPILFLIQFILCTGCALLISSLNVYFRDIEHILSILLMAWYFFTPVMYGLEMLPEQIRPLMMLNPMALLTISYRDIMFYGNAINLEVLSYSIIFAVTVFFIGYFTFNRLQRHFAEEL